MLRLIAIDRASMSSSSRILAVVLFTFAGHDTALHGDYVEHHERPERAAIPARPGCAACSATCARRSSTRRRHLIVWDSAVIAYACLEATEMVGLWSAEAVGRVPDLHRHHPLIPWRSTSCTSGSACSRSFTFVINVLVVVYLLLAKRLFGVRGGMPGRGWNEAASSAVGRRSTATPGRLPTRASFPSADRRSARAPDCRARSAPAGTGWYRRPSRAVGAVGSALA